MADLIMDVRPYDPPSRLQGGVPYDNTVTTPGVLYESMGADIFGGTWENVNVGICFTPSDATPAVDQYIFTISNDDAVEFAWLRLVSNNTLRWEIPGKAGASASCGTVDGEMIWAWVSFSQTEFVASVNDIHPVFASPSTHAVAFPTGGFNQLILGALSYNGSSPIANQTFDGEIHQVIVYEGAGVPGVDARTAIYNGADPISVLEIIGKVILRNWKLEPFYGADDLVAGASLGTFQGSPSFQNGGYCYLHDQKPSTNHVGVLSNTTDGHHVASLPAGFDGDNFSLGWFNYQSGANRDVCISDGTSANEEHLRWVGSANANMIANGTGSLNVSTGNLNFNDHDSRLVPVTYVKRSSTDRELFLNHVSVLQETTSVVNTGLDTLQLGRRNDFGGSNRAWTGGRIYIHSPALDENGILFCQAGGDPRLVGTCVAFWDTDVSGGVVPLVDVVGGNDLSEVGTGGSSETDRYVCSSAFSPRQEFSANRPQLEALNATIDGCGFDGSTTYMTFGKPIGLLVEPYSWVGVMKHDTATTNPTLFSQAQDGDEANEKFAWRFPSSPGLPGTPLWLTHDGGGSQGATANGDWSENTVHTVSVIHDGTNVTVRLDGNPDVTSGITNAPASCGRFILGADQVVGGGLDLYWDGVFGALKVFTDALTSSQASSEEGGLIPVAWDWVGRATVGNFLLTRLFQESMDLVGVAEMTPEFKKLAYLGLEGIADLGFSMGLSFNNDLSAVARAYMSLGANVFTTDMVFQATADFGFSTSLRFNMEFPFQSTADFDFTIFRTMFQDLEFQALARMDFVTEMFQQVINPPLAGGVVDVSDPINFQLIVDGGQIDLGTTCRFNVEQLEVSYDGKELLFSEITAIGTPTYLLEQTVSLDVDFTGVGSSLERVFTGRIRSREHLGENNNELVSYVSLGNQQLANTTLINSNGKPDVEFTVGTTITSVMADGVEVTTIFAKPLNEAVQDVFTLHAPALNTLGIPATIGAPGLEVFTVELPETTEFTNVGFVNALAQLSAFQPGVKPFYDDRTGTWVFHNLLTAPVAVIDVSSVNLTALPYDVSTDERFTAVRLFANIEDGLDDAIINKSNSITVNGFPGSVQRTTLTLQPFWISSLQVDWTLLKALAPNPFTLEDQNFFVYKRWKIPQNAPLPFPGTPFTAMQRTNYYGDIKYSRLHGRTLFDRRLFMARFHAIGRGNPFVEGDVIGPQDVTLTYYPLALPVTLQTSVTSEGSPVLINTIVDTSAFLDEIRMPASGWEGTAFTDYGVERELVRIVDRTEVTSLNARALLDIHKDAIISGQLPIEGDPIQRFIHLGKQVRVQEATQLTGIQSRNAMMTAYTYTFAKRGLSEISLTTDITGLIRTV